VPPSLVKIESAPDLVDQVYRALLDAISDGSLSPGERITQDEIASQLSVSRQPVLQALRLLKNDGFVLDAPGRGVLVAPLDSDWIAKVYEVRAALDALAARLAATRRARIDPRLIEQGRRACHGKNIKAMIEADVAFHNAIYGAARNPLIEQSAHLHWRHIRRAMGAVLRNHQQREVVWDEHAAIAAAIGRGDAASAVRLMDEHSQDASANLSAQLKEVLQATQGDTP
jgi:DNA-binding GntR family transcriptional regulator